MSKNDTTNGSTATATPAKAVKPSDLKTLFGHYDSASKKVEDAKLALEKALQGRSATVEAICTAAGGRKGPFRHPGTGLVLSVVERKAKDGGPSNWYFKGPNASDVIEV